MGLDVFLEYIITDFGEAGQGARGAVDEAGKSFRIERGCFDVSAVPLGEAKRGVGAPGCE